MINIANFYRKDTSLEAGGLVLLDQSGECGSLLYQLAKQGIRAYNPHVLRTLAVPNVTFYDSERKYKDPQAFTKGTMLLWEKSLWEHIVWSWPYTFFKAKTWRFNDKPLSQYTPKEFIEYVMNTPSCLSSLVEAAAPVIGEQIQTPEAEAESSAPVKATAPAPVPEEEKPKEELTQEPEAKEQKEPAKRMAKTAWNKKQWQKWKK